MCVLPAFAAAIMIDADADAEVDAGVGLGELLRVWLAVLVLTTL